MASRLRCSVGEKCSEECFLKHFVKEDFSLHNPLDCVNLSDDLLRTIRYRVNIDSRRGLTTVVVSIPSMIHHRSLSNKSKATEKWLFPTGSSKCFLWIQQRGRQWKRLLRKLQNGTITWLLFFNVMY